MTHRGSSYCKVRYNFHYLRLAISFLLRDADWSAVSWRKDCTWKTPRLFASVCLLWAWGDQKRVVDCFLSARDIALAIFPQREAVAGSYQAFLKLLIRWNDQLCRAVSEALRQRMREEFSEQMQVGRFCIMAIDGSRIGVPRTRSNEKAFSCKRKKKKRKKKHRCRSDEKKAHAATIWLTTLWNCGTGLPWMWRLGPGDSSERTHWLEMIPQAPPKTIFVADGGFVGYEYLQKVIQAGQGFIIRVGSNVRLMKKLGYALEREATVYLWPKKEAKKHSPPLVLRLVIATGGRHPVYLLTSVTSAGQLSDADIIAAYRKRWGVELFYRHLKQTFGKHKLRSTSPEAAYAELDWAFLGLWCMAAYALKQLLRQGIPPERLSFAQLIRAFQLTMRNYLAPQQKQRSLCRMLREALIDQYQRGDKTSRGYPRKKNDRHRPSAPEILQATPEEIALAKQIFNQQTLILGLTA